MSELQRSPSQLDDQIGSIPWTFIRTESALRSDAQSGRWDEMSRAAGARV
jgi:hypothetical protein